MLLNYKKYLGNRISEDISDEIDIYIYIYIYIYYYYYQI